MQMWKKGCAGLVLLAGLTPALRAQTLTPPSVGGVAPAPVAGAPRTLWEFLGVSKAQRQACKEYICKTQMGQLMNNSLKPLGAITGGMFGPCCPPFNAEDLNKPADSAEGAAARIKQDEAAAKARRAAVRYLGTVDCHFWPEAQDALVGALRTDRNECVRWEAAMVLGSGCCCTKATIKALAITVSGSEEDGNPGETSERVKCAANYSLHHCLSSCAAVVQPLPIEEGIPDKLTPEPAPPPRPEKPPEGPGSALDYRPNEYYKNVRKLSMHAVVEDARRVAARADETPARVAPQPPQPRVERTIFGIAKTALTEPAEKPQPSAALPPKPAPEPPQAPRGPVAAPQAPMTPISYAPAPTPEPRVAMTPAIYPAPVATTPMPPVAPTAPAPMPTVALMPPMLPIPPAPHLVTLLTNSVDPEQREWAASQLSHYSGQSNPQALQAVMNAAQRDPAPIVRAACVRTLVRMNVNTWPVLTTVQALKADSDPRVKHEADQALVKLVPGLGAGTLAPPATR